ncbi:hypothetical protein [Clostridium sp. C8]|jgi:hypothetical protein|uniref:hypothetical protein n=1 Tax=Clostridium sp. C8 TaxID=1667357 RepID=UPI00062E7A95|nr:hypothetical protein [Clostridium sp. C8]KLE15321.1 hypothetical protein AAT22_12470 [Clostridium sp. C8]MDU1566150.1 hypothetical protein [Clostridium sp.]
MEKEFIKFSKDFMYVIGDNGDRVDVPQLVAKAFNRHRYVKETKELQVQCVQCKIWIAIMKIIDGKFVDIHDKSMIDKIFIRDRQEFYFSNRCLNCKEKLTVKKESNIINQIEKNNKYSLYLKPSNKEYLEFKAAALGIDIAETLNRIIEKDKTVDNIQKLKDEFAKRVDRKFKL